MTIDEAIKILDDIRLHYLATDIEDHRDAIKLGSEALKEIKWLHESHVLHDDELLPGETKD